MLATMPLFLEIKRMFRLAETISSVVKMFSSLRLDSKMFNSEQIVPGAQPNRKEALARSDK